MRQKSGSFVYIEVSTRVSKGDSIIHIRNRCTAANRLFLFEGSACDFTLKVFDRETLEGSYMSRVGSNGRKFDIIQSEVVTTVLQAGIEVDDANRHIVTGNGRRGDRGYTMPTIVSIVTQVNSRTEVVPSRSSVVTNLELESCAIIHLTKVIDVGHPEGKEVTYA